jgi:prepilin-type N-terminal cleavage/methylation domain-containing protein
MNPAHTRFVFHEGRPVDRRPAGAHAAFTLPEIMIVMAVFSLLVIALITCQLFGMRLERVSETKFAATAAGRKALNQVRNEIRQGKVLMIGTGDDAVFTRIADNAPQVGNALQIYPTTNTASYIRYYLDAGDNSLKRVTSLNSQPEVVAGFITNHLIFQAEDFLGNVLTNEQNNRVIRLTMEFYRWEYPIATVGNGGMYDYYRLQTRITRRLIE